MKTIIRHIFIYTLILYFLPFVVPGVHITGGFLTLLIGGIGLSVIFLVIKPILNIISLPINLVTLGLFSVVTNVVIIYLLTVFITGISIVPFIYPQTEILGFVIPKISFTLIFAYLYTSFVLSFLDSFFRWLVS